MTASAFRRLGCVEGEVQQKANKRPTMEAIKITMTAAERKPCVCGATISITRNGSQGAATEVWLCARHCGARGLTYAGALRRKIHLDLLSWGDLRRSARALIETGAEAEPYRRSSLNS
jgi:hypothetical protein